MKNYQLTIEDIIPDTPYNLKKFCFLSMCEAMKAQDHKKAKYWLKEYNSIILD